MKNEKSASKSGLDMFFGQNFDSPYVSDNLQQFWRFDLFDLFDMFLTFDYRRTEDQVLLHDNYSHGQSPMV